MSFRLFNVISDWLKRFFVGFYNYSSNYHFILAKQLYSLTNDEIWVNKWESLKEVTINIIKFRKHKHFYY